MHIRNYRILTSLLAACVLAQAEAKESFDAPRLVVNITIDQLRSDFMEAFMPLYGERGFKRLMREGCFCTRGEYPFVGPDRASAVASIHTGASPYEHGIIGNYWMDRNSLRPVSCVSDAGYETLPVGSVSYSPALLKTSTLSDELKLATDGAALVYSVAPEYDAALLSAGHAADGAYWLSDESGQWCTSSYYGTYPDWIYRNDSVLSLAENLKHTTWEPLNKEVASYNYLIGSVPEKTFSYNFKGNDRFVLFKTSGLINASVCDFVRTCLSNTLMGQDEITDLLSVTLYAGGYDRQLPADYPMEYQDTYVRLDQQLGALIDDLERRFGPDRVLFVVTSTGYFVPEKPNLSKFRIPTGLFSMKKASALLNMYLMAVYGPGQYVETTYNSEIYLNKKLIEDKQLYYTEILQRSQDFLIQLEGVQDVFTSNQVTVGAWSPKAERIRNSYHPRRSGDLFIDVSSGWRLETENQSEPVLIREAYINFPLFFLDCHIKNKVIETPVTVDCIAPTLAQFMRIRAPNACSAFPLSDLR